MAIVLLNPAPTLPQSGTLTRKWFESQDQSDASSSSSHGEDDPYSSCWPRDPTSRIVSDANDEEESIEAAAFGSPSTKAGRIISRGTLVVCNVSLVGQWVDEAKSKLKDPGK